MSNISHTEALCAWLRRVFIVASIALIAGLPASGLAQTPRGRPETPASADPAKRPEPAARLPADVTTEHTIELPGRALRFKATAGSIPINDGEGKLIAEIAYTAYVRAEGDAARPVTFVFNGGPGASSAYLQFGAMGPWRLPLDKLAPSSSPIVAPNAETWLDFTDLVFVDPVGTGYSKFIASGDDIRKRIWSVDGDIEALATFIRKWTEKSSRFAATKFIVGESYGGFRAPKIARALQGQQGVGVHGLVLVSPVLDFGWRGLHRHSPLGWVSRLPSFAATAREGRQPFDREALREVERYAATEYLADLVRGERDTAAVERISARVAAFTGLDPALVRRLAGRVDMSTFLRELNRTRGLVGSAYDATITALDPEPGAATSHHPDPLLEAMRAPLTAAAVDVYQRLLGWRSEAPYWLLSREVRWDWGGGRSTHQAVSDLGRLLALDPHLRVLVTHGASDLVTPYFESQLILDQLPAFTQARISLSVYGGGHMYYSRDASRRLMREDAARLYGAATASPRG